MNRWLCFLILAPLLLRAESPSDVQKQIETAYAKSLAALHEAKSIEDLDEISRSLDTRDWKSIVPGRGPWTWEDLRKHPFESLTAPFDSAALIIESLDLQGDTAMLSGKLRIVNHGRASLVPLKETWVRTVVGWKRKIHEKPGPPIPEPSSTPDKPGT